MRFEEILPALREGKKVRRTSWPITDTLAEVAGEPDSYTIGSNDLFSDDWEILEEKREPMRFSLDVGAGVTTGLDDTTVGAIMFDDYRLRPGANYRVTVEELSGPPDAEMSTEPVRCECTDCPTHPGRKCSCRCGIHDPLPQEEPPPEAERESKCPTCKGTISANGYHGACMKAAADTGSAGEALYRAWDGVNARWEDRPQEVWEARAQAVIAWHAARNPKPRHWTDDEIQTLVDEYRKENSVNAGIRRVLGVADELRKGGPK
jgi:hypothetical protein